MPYHLTPSTQQAKGLAFKGSPRPNDNPIIASALTAPQNARANNTNATTSANPTLHLGLFHPSSRISSTHSTPLAMVLLYAIVLSLLSAALFYLIKCLIASAFARAPNLQLKKKHRRRKSKPPPLNLGADIEAQNRPPPRYYNPFDPSPTPTSMTSTDFEPESKSAVASGVDTESLTPFTPVKQRLRCSHDSVGEGSDGVEDEKLKTEDLVGEEGEGSPLGLSRYFFVDGVGISRYESSGRRRVWKEGEGARA